MKKLVAVLAGVFFLFGASFANELKLGVVDLQKIMQTSPQMKTIQENLEKEFKPRRDNLVKMEEDIKGDMEKFKRDNAVMSKAQKEALEKKIMQAQQSFDREGQQYQQELSAAHNKAMENFYNQIREGVAKVAKASNFDIILQKDAALYSAEQFEITQSVMKQLK